MLSSDILLITVFYEYARTGTECKISETKCLCQIIFDEPDGQQGVLEFSERSKPSQLQKDSNKISKYFLITKDSLNLFAKTLLRLTHLFHKTS
jgi:hypothetical protein